MDKEKRIQVIKQQYDKIFGQKDASKQTKPQSKDERFLSNLSRIVNELMDLQLGEETFDSITLSAYETNEFTPDDYVALVNEKFLNLVRVLDNSDKDCIKYKEESGTLKTKLTKKVKQSEALLDRLKNELQYHITKYREYTDLMSKKREQAQELQIQLGAKDNNIIELNRSIKNMMDEYVILTDRSIECDKRLDILREEFRHFSQAKQELERKRDSNQEIIEEKVKDFENLRAQEQILSLKFKQKEKKYNTSATKLNKNQTENDKALNEYTRTMEKNSGHMKRIQEIEKLKEDLQKEIETKSDELEKVRVINLQFEDRINTLPILETTLRTEEQLYNRLASEQRHLNKQIEELAPHSITDEDVDDDLAHDLSLNADIEKYSEMSPDEIEEELSMFRMQASKNAEYINRLEAQNNEKIDFINGQKRTLQRLRDDYVDKIQEFHQIKEAKEETEVRDAELAEEVKLLIKNFHGLSSLLGENPEDAEDEEIENMMNYKFSFNQRENSKEDTIPKPLELHVTPSTKDLKDEPISIRNEYSPERMDQDNLLPPRGTPRGTPASSRKITTNASNPNSGRK